MMKDDLLTCWLTPQVIRSLNFDYGVNRRQPVPLGPIGFPTGKTKVHASRNAELSQKARGLTTNILDFGMKSNRYIFFAIRNSCQLATWHALLFLSRPDL